MNQRLLLIGGLLTLTMSSYADSIKFTCAIKEPNQIEMIECAAEKYNESDHQLNILYQNKMKMLKMNKANQLRISQRKWIAEKEANCNHYTEEESGSNGRLESFECSLQMTKERIRFLQKY